MITKRQNQFLDLSIMITEFEDLYMGSDHITGKKFAVFSHKSGDQPISNFGNFKEIQQFIHGMNYILNLKKRETCKN